MTDLTTLRRLLREASPKPWRHVWYDQPIDFMPDEEHGST